MAKPQLAVVPDTPPSPNSLELTEAERRSLLINGLTGIELLVAQKDLIVSGIRTARKKLVANGFAPKVIDFALRLRKDEDDKIVEQRRAEIEVARFLNHPVGTQPDLPFDMQDRTPLVDKALAEGEAAGAAGVTCKAPYSGEAEQAWIRGWDQGQAAIASAFKKLEAKAKVDAEEVADEEGDD